jgi:DNA-binding XRE family transcriptional regulator
MTRLAEMIEKQGTTIRRLAQESGIPERTVYRHVNGETAPDLQQAAAYAKALRIRIEDLVSDAAA